MSVKPETAQFLTDLERFANKRFEHGTAVGFLLEEARARGMMQVFDDLVFIAKFLAKTFDLLKRIGPDGEGYVKISGEFQSNLEKAQTLVKTLLKESPDEQRRPLVEAYLSLDQESMVSFMALVRELAWVKNWTLDGKPLP